jgi:hypothetical protein
VFIDVDDLRPELGCELAISFCAVVMSSINKPYPNRIQVFYLDI